MADKKYGRKVGACRVKTNDSSSLMVCEANDMLYYYDGMINLTYSNGQACPENTKQKTVTHITFLCNASAPIVLKPEYEMIDSCTYNFRWRTKFACPAKVQCILLKILYDSSSLEEQIIYCRSVDQMISFPQGKLFT